MNGDLDGSVGSSTAVRYKIDSITLMVYKLACCRLMSDGPNICTVRHGCFTTWGEVPEQSYCRTINFYSAPEHGYP
jgi:hypothetical protein